MELGLLRIVKQSLSKTSEVSSDTADSKMVSEREKSPVYVETFGLEGEIESGSDSLYWREISLEMR